MTLFIGDQTNGIEPLEKQTNTHSKKVFKYLLPANSETNVRIESTHIQELNRDRQYIHEFTRFTYFADIELYSPGNDVKIEIE